MSDPLLCAVLYTPYIRYTTLKLTLWFTIRTWQFNAILQLKALFFHILLTFHFFKQIVLLYFMVFINNYYIEKTSSIYFDFLQIILISIQLFKKHQHSMKKSTLNLLLYESLPASDFWHLECEACPKSLQCRQRLYCNLNFT